MISNQHFLLRLTKVDYENNKFKGEVCNFCTIRRIYTEL